jgi:parallel beta-helix repeat protein
MSFPLRALCALTLLVPLTGITPTDAATRCDRHASPRGSDAAPGTAARPFRSVQRLARALRPGQTGCLERGEVFRGDVKIDRGGRPGRPITIRSEEGPRATVAGRLYVSDRANDVTIARLALDGRSARLSPSPIVSGDRVTFSRNDVTNHHTATCFLIGSLNGFGAAYGLRLAQNRIHDCGQLPRTNRDHGIYLESSYGAVIVDNSIFDNADRGIQMYPNAQRTLVARNVIDGNGEGVIFSGDQGYASSANVVRDNVIANSDERNNVESYWPAGNPIGIDNRVFRNCLWNGRRGNVGARVGFAASGNVVGRPAYVNRAQKRFRIPTGRCAGLAPRV